MAVKPVSAWTVGANAGRFDLETGSGNITGELAGTIEDISVETGSGDVVLHLPSSISGTIDLETGSGDFSVAFPVTLVRKGDNSLRGKIGEGTARIHVETGSGNIELLR